MSKSAAGLIDSFVAEKALDAFRRRSAGKRPSRRYYLIVCEGEKTEPNYFEALRQQLTGGEGDRIVVVGGKDNTLRLVEKAEEEVENRKRSSLPPYYHVWLVFDRDSFPEDDFDNAIASATRSAEFGPCGEFLQPHWHAAWSNEAFELWYILHFKDGTGGGIKRDRYKKMLEHFLGHPYAKNSPSMFNELLPRMESALTRARRGFEKWPDAVPCHDRNPATAVYQLVDALMQYME